MRTLTLILFFLLKLENVSSGTGPTVVQPPSPQSARYQQHTDHDPDGTGKFYMGREISKVMGHLGANWLERPSRYEEERPDLLIQALDVKVGQFVADIGAGTGFFSLRLARKVGPKGRVLAVDIQREMLDKLSNRLKEENISTVIPILGSETNPHIPLQTLDLVLMVDVYHEFSYPWEMMQKIEEALKPGGRVVLVEYRAEDPSVPIKNLHKMSESQVIQEITQHDLIWKETKRTLPRQHIIIFEHAGDNRK